jgi:hypothetical protein
MSNYTLIQTKHKVKAFHLYYHKDKCLYKKNGTKNGINFYKCLVKSCKCSGKVINNQFVPLKQDTNKHEHENHELKAESEMILSKIKDSVYENPETPVRKIFFEKIKK